LACSIFGELLFGEGSTFSLYLELLRESTPREEFFERFLEAFERSFA